MLRRVSPALLQQRDRDTFHNSATNFQSFPARPSGGVPVLSARARRNPALVGLRPVRPVARLCVQDSTPATLQMETTFCVLYKHGVWFRASADVSDTTEAALEYGELCDGQIQGESVQTDDGRFLPIYSASGDTLLAPMRSMHCFRVVYMNGVAIRGSPCFSDRQDRDVAHGEVLEGCRLCPGTEQDAFVLYFQGGKPQGYLPLCFPESGGPILECVQPSAMRQSKDGLDGDLTRISEEFYVPCNPSVRHSISDDLARVSEDFLISPNSAAGWPAQSLPEVVAGRVRVSLREVQAGVLRPWQLELLGAVASLEKAPAIPPCT